MHSRLELHNLLLKVIGNNNVYYQPPESIKINYPCIIYKRSDINNLYANDDIYKQNYAYQVTIMDKDPDSEIVKKMSKLKYSKFDRHFASDGINHDVFTIYY